MKLSYFLSFICLILIAISFIIFHETKYTKTQRENYRNVEMANETINQLKSMHTRKSSVYVPIIKGFFTLGKINIDNMIDEYRIMLKPSYTDIEHTFGQNKNTSIDTLNKITNIDNKFGEYIENHHIFKNNLQLFNNGKSNDITLDGYVYKFNKVALHLGHEIKHNVLKIHKDSIYLLMLKPVLIFCPGVGIVQPIWGNIIIDTHTTEENINLVIKKLDDQQQNMILDRRLVNDMASQHGKAVVAYYVTDYFMNVNKSKTKHVLNMVIKENKDYERIRTATYDTNNKISVSIDEQKCYVELQTIGHSKKFDINLVREVDQTTVVYLCYSYDMLMITSMTKNKMCMNHYAVDELKYQTLIVDDDIKGIRKDVIYIPGKINAFFNPYNSVVDVVTKLRETNADINMNKYNGEIYSVGQRIYSDTKKAYLVLDTDGALRLRQSDGRVIWTNNTHDIETIHPERMHMTNTGELVLADRFNIIFWKSRRGKTFQDKHPFKIKVFDDRFCIQGKYKRVIFDSKKDMGYAFMPDCQSASTIYGRIHENSIKLERSQSRTPLTNWDHYTKFKNNNIYWPGKICV